MINRSKSAITDKRAKSEKEISKKTSNTQTKTISPSIININLKHSSFITRQQNIYTNKKRKRSKNKTFENNPIKGLYKQNIIKRYKRYNKTKITKAI